MGGEGAATENEVGRREDWKDGQECFLSYFHCCLCIIHHWSSSAALIVYVGLFMFVYSSIYLSFSFFNAHPINKRTTASRIFANLPSGIRQLTCIISTLSPRTRIQSTFLSNNYHVGSSKCQLYYTLCSNNNNKWRLEYKTSLYNGCSNDRGTYAFTYPVSKVLVTKYRCCMK